MEISEQVMLYGLDDPTEICLLDDGVTILRVSDVFKELAKARQQLEAMEQEADKEHAKAVEIADLYRDARDKLEAIRFIPVTERLPEHETTEQWEMYLCKLNRYGDEKVAPLSFKGSHWYSESLSSYDDWVVGWMPLSAIPAQPEEV